MKKGISQTAVIFVFALLLGFGITLMTPQEVLADECHPETCIAIDPSCTECDDDGPCRRSWTRKENLPGTGCCGFSTFMGCLIFP